MLYQTAVEESFARGIELEGDGPVFSTDWVSDNLAQREPELAHLKGKPARGLEIGSFEGRSAIWFAENILTHPDARLTCVDLFGARLDDFFDHNLKATGVADRIIKRKGFSRDVLKTLPVDSYDFVYVDGCHLATCAMEDMVLSWMLLKVGGIMIVDDYTWDGNERLNVPAPAIDAFLELYAPAIELIAKDTQASFRKVASGY
jgi:predicted O-methyltransferase YrrM